MGEGEEGRQRGVASEEEGEGEERKGVEERPVESPGGREKKDENRGCKIHAGCTKRN